MNIPRLHRLRAILVEVLETERTLDMGSWAYCTFSQIGFGPDHVCHTTACAAGYAALDPELNSQGLCLSFRYAIEKGRAARHGAIVNSFGANGQILINSAAELHAAVQKHPKYMVRLCYFDGVHRHYDFNAAAKFFGLSDRAAAYLFDNETYTSDEAEDYGAIILNDDEVTARHVIERLDYLLVHDGEAPWIDPN